MSYKLWYVKINSQQIEYISIVRIATASDKSHMIINESLVIYYYYCHDDMCIVHVL